MKRAAGSTSDPVETLSECLGYKWPRGGDGSPSNRSPRQRSARGGIAGHRAGRSACIPHSSTEVVSMFLMFLLLMAYYPLRRHDGQVIAVLMAGYGVHRYLNELLHDDPRPKGFESYTSVFLVAAGIAMWVYLRLGQPSFSGTRRKPRRDRNPRLIEAVQGRHDRYRLHALASVSRRSGNRTIFCLAEPREWVK